MRKRNTFCRRCGGGTWFTLLLHGAACNLWVGHAQFGNPCRCRECQVVAAAIDALRGES